MHDGNTISPYAHPLFLAGLPGVLGILAGLIYTVSASVMGHTFGFVLGVYEVSQPTMETLGGVAQARSFSPWTSFAIMLIVGTVIAYFDRRCLIKRREFLADYLTARRETGKDSWLAVKRILCEWPLILLFGLLVFPTIKSRSGAMAHVLEFAAAGALIAPLILTWQPRKDIYDTARARLSAKDKDGSSDVYCQPLPRKQRTIAGVIVAAWLAVISYQVYLTARFAQLEDEWKDTFQVVLPDSAAEPAETYVGNPD